MQISPSTIGICLELLAGIKINVTAADGDEMWTRCRLAYQELQAALTEESE